MTETILFLSQGPNVLYPNPCQQDTKPEIVLQCVNTANAVVETIITWLDFFFPKDPVKGAEDDARSDDLPTSVTKKEDEETKSQDFEDMEDADKSSDDWRKARFFTKQFLEAKAFKSYEESSELQTQDEPISVRSPVMSYVAYPT